MIYDYNIVLLEKPLDEGLTAEECTKMFDMLSGSTALPIDIQAENACAMGFVNRLDAEFMDYDFTELTNIVTNILNDMEKENPTHEYNIPNAHGLSRLYLARNLPE